MRRLKFISAVLILTMLCGCSSLMEGDYRIVTDHVDTGSSQETTASIYEIHTYAGLKNAVQRLVNSAAEQGIIRAVEYSGSVSEDISRVCLDITRESPIGSYAVEYITHTVTRIVTYDEIDLHISYKLSSEEIAAIRSASSVADFYQMIDEALGSGSPQLAASLVTLSVNEQALKKYVEDFYWNHPEKLLYKPSVSIGFFPSVDYVQKIAVLDFQYYSTEEQRSSGLTELLDSARALMADCDLSHTAEAAMQCCTRLSSSASVHPKGRTAYDVLVGRSGGSEGFALAYQLLCNMCGIPCRIVSGMLNGSSHYWNIIQLGSFSYHVDCAECASSGLSGSFLKNDNEMKLQYWWEPGQYPECAGTLTYEAVLASYNSRLQENPDASESIDPEREPGTGD